MRDPFHSSVSAEKFAAYIDGSLPSSEMCRVSAKISGDPELQEQLAVCDDVDRALEQAGDTEFALPEELSGDDFEIPSIPGRYERAGFGGMLAASMACVVAPKCAVDFSVEAACDADEGDFDDLSDALEEEPDEE